MFSTNVEQFGIYKIQVIDSGIGISEPDLKSLFTPFFQATDKKSKALNMAGHGLGLSISHKIAKILGGSLTAESE